MAIYACDRSNALYISQKAIEQYGAEKVVEEFQTTFEEGMDEFVSGNCARAPPEPPTLHTQQTQHTSRATVRARRLMPDARSLFLPCRAPFRGSLEDALREGAVDLPARQAVAARAHAHGHARQPPRLWARHDAVCRARRLAGLPHPAEQVARARAACVCVHGRAAADGIA